MVLQRHHPVTLQTLERRAAGIVAISVSGHAQLR
jgi:hypothetical protein